MSDVSSAPTCMLPMPTIPTTPSAHGMMSDVSSASTCMPGAPTCMLPMPTIPTMPSMPCTCICITGTTLHVLYCFVLILRLGKSFECSNLRSFAAHSNLNSPFEASLFTL